MPYILVAKHLHVWFALLTFVGFSLRFLWLIGRSDLLHKRWVKILPHINDTGLLISGVTLAIFFGYSPFAVFWFGVKLALIALYIVLGVLLFRTHQNRLYQITLFSMSFTTYFFIIIVVLTKPN
ncbi:SirB2 family protein [Teredinibacter turnerae]|uniref:SirB2 family protein n=1 Tax=Teredinibacter turnerae TaxID=2426 RepID=UPI0009B7E2A3|nr:SirB2 family protein [Teredinibacter turnerae]